MSIITDKESITTAIVKKQPAESNGKSVDSKKKSVNYVNNQEFLEALAEYKKLCVSAKKAKREKPRVPDYIGERFLMIAKHLSQLSIFYRYTFREDMIMDGVENSLLYFENFNPRKSKNPFAYFTQIIYYAFLRKIAREKRQLYIRYKSAQQCLELNAEEIKELEELGQTPMIYDNISEFIATYELSRETKKQKQLEKRMEKTAKGKEKRGIEVFID